MTKKELVWLVALVVLGAVLRLDFLIAHHFTIDSDEAIVGLMAKHLIERGDISTFYYGQHYMGSFEAIAAAALFLIGGSSPMLLKLTPLLFSLLLIVQIYFMARMLTTPETLERRIVPWVAAILAAIPASPLVIWSSMARGGFIEIVCIGTLAFLLLIGWIKSVDTPARGLGTVGLVLGFGWWVNNQIIFFMIPTALVACVVLLRGSGVVRLITGGLAGCAGFLLGGAPFWIYNLTHEFASFGIFKAATWPEFVAHLYGALTTSVPILLGAKRFWGTQETFDGALLMMSVLYGFLLCALVYDRRCELIRLLGGTVDRRQPVEVLLLFVIGAVVVFSATSFGSLVEAPRYLLPLYPALCVLTAFGACAAWRWAGLGLLSVGGVVVLNLLSSYAGGRAIPGEPFVYATERAAKDHRELIEWLAGHNYRYVRTNYWIGYRLAFESNERIKFLLFKEPSQVRIPEYERDGGELPEYEVPYVLTPGQAKFFELVKAQGCMNFESVSLSGYTVLTHVTRAYDEDISLALIPRDAVAIAATHQSSQAGLALDGDLATRWGSGEKQNPSMQVTLDLLTPQTLRLLKIQLGGWKTDFPRALRIELQSSQGESIVWSEAHTKALSYVSSDSSELALCITPREVRRVVLSQTGSDSFFDWSIAEILLYGERIIPDEVINTTGNSGS